MPGYRSRAAARRKQPQDTYATAERRKRQWDTYALIEAVRPNPAALWELFRRLSNAGVELWPVVRLAEEAGKPFTTEELTMVMLAINPKLVERRALPEGRRTEDSP